MFDNGKLPGPCGICQCAAGLLTIFKIKKSGKVAADE